jgi:hypothetical protein
MKKSTKPTDAVRLQSKVVYKPKGKPPIAQSYALNATNLHVDVPQGTQGVLTLSVNARYMMDLGEEYESTWMIDATGEGIKITALSSQKLDSQFFDKDSIDWTIGTAESQIQVKVDATFEKWFQSGRFTSAQRLS